MLKLYSNIKDRRQQLNMTQSELAEIMGYADKGMISRIENGQIDLSQSKILAFAKALGVTPAYLMGWEDDLEHAASGEGPSAADPGAPDAPARLSAPEEQLLDNFRQLNDEGQELVTNYTSDLVATGRYIKSHPAQLVD